MTERVFRLFVSSPSDVVSERLRVDAIVERLNTELHGAARLEVIRWETSFYSAHDTFQRQIPEAAECDVVIAIFKARLGTELPSGFPHLPTGEPYPSGTAYEVLTAINARKSGHDLPDIYVFRRPQPPLVALDDPQEIAIREQWQRLKAFFERWFYSPGGEFVAAFQEFGSSDDFATKLEECLRQWLERKGFSRQAAFWDRRLHGSPFRGLAPFDAEYASVFFGRSGIIRRAATRLREAAERNCPFLLVIGASGAGKSSLLRAGLLPFLTRPGSLPEVDHARSVVVTPDDNPALALAQALFDDRVLGTELRSGDFREPPALAAAMSAKGAAAIAPIRSALERAASRRAELLGYEHARTTRLLLGIDQAERLFSEATPEAAQTFVAFVKALAEEGLAYVICVLRNDAYPQFQLYPDLLSLRASGATIDVLPPSRSEIEEIVTAPVLACRPPLAFEMRDGRSLADALIDDSRGGDALPLLQLTLERLAAAEAARGDGVLRFADYGGIEQAVTLAAGDALKSIGGDRRRDDITALVTALVRDVVTDPVTGTAVPMIEPVNRADFEAGQQGRRELVDAFVAGRLLTSDRSGDVAVIRPVHDALLRSWPEAKAIVAENESLIRVRRTLEPIVRDWRSAPARDRDGYLDLPPALLAGAQALLRRLPGDLSPDMRALIEGAVAADQRRRDAERQEQERRIRDAEALAAARRRTVVLSTVGLVVAVGLAAATAYQWFEAEKARRDILVEWRIQSERAEQAASANIENARLREVVRKASDSLRSGAREMLAAGNAASALAIAQSLRLMQQEFLGVLPDDEETLFSLVSTYQQIGDAQAALGGKEASLVAFREALSRLDVFNTKDPENVQWQLNTVVLLIRVAKAGGEPREKLTRALSIVNALDAIGKLPPDRRDWITQIQKMLADLPAQ